MEAVLWYVLTGTNGSTNRTRVLQALDERPRNANQLADDLELDYKTIRHHLDVLMDNQIVSHSNDDYDRVYSPTKKARQNWATIDTIMETVY